MVLEELGLLFIQEDIILEMQGGLHLPVQGVVLLQKLNWDQ